LRLGELDFEKSRYFEEKVKVKQERQLLTERLDEFNAILVKEWDRISCSTAELQAQRETMHKLTVKLEQKLRKQNYFLENPGLVSDFETFYKLWKSDLIDVVK
jgi:phage regulator Rha-like protein